MIEMTLGQINEAIQGNLTGAAGDIPVAAVSTDSRTIKPGEVFFALAGERFDGHSFVPEVLEAGALAAVVSKKLPQLPVGMPLISVDNTLTAYGALASWVRRQFEVTVIGVTGSAGKTTTKDMIGSIVGLSAPTLVAPLTENNEIGVPRTLLNLDDSYQYCVLELAMRGPHEIEYLAGIASPQIGVITNIGRTHIGRLGSQEAIAQAKAELLNSLPTQGTAVLNADDFYSPLLTEMATCRVISFGTSPEAQVRATDIRLRGLEGSDFTLQIGAETIPVSMNLPGHHNILNAAAAAAAAWAATGTTTHIAQGLQSCVGEAMRWERHQAPQGAVIINDAYNASPTSVAAALEVLGQVAGRKIFVFGDMLELGETSEREHRRVGQLCAQQGIDWLITLGHWAPLAAAEAESADLRTDVADSPHEAAQLIKAQLTAEDVVLIKASRKIALEKVAEELTRP